MSTATPGWRSPERVQLTTQVRYTWAAVVGFAVAAVAWWLLAVVGWLLRSDRLVDRCAAASSITLAALLLAVAAIAVATMLRNSASRAGPAMVTAVLMVCWGHLAAVVTALVVLVVLAAVRAEHIVAGLNVFGFALYALIQVTYARRHASTYVTAQHKQFGTHTAAQRGCPATDPAPGRPNR